MTDIRAVADLIDDQIGEYQRRGNAGVDHDWLLASLDGAGLLALIAPVRMLKLRSNLPAEAFHPRAYLRRLIHRSRLGAPREQGWVLATYKQIAAELQDSRKYWRDDPAYVLLLGLSVLGGNRQVDAEAPLAPEGLSITCTFCWRPGDRKTGRCVQHRSRRRPPPGHHKFSEFRRMLTTEIRRLEPIARQEPQFSCFNQHVEVEEENWQAAKQAYEVGHDDDMRLAFQQASVRFEKLIQDESLVINASTISYVAFHLAEVSTRRSPLAIGLLGRQDGLTKPLTMAEIGRSIGISRQAVKSHMLASAEAWSVVTTVVRRAVPLPPSAGPRDRERIRLQRQVMIEALALVAVARVRPKRQSQTTGTHL